MKRISFAVALVFAAGCGNLSGILSILGLSPTSVTVRVFNQAGFDVEPNIYVSSVDGLVFDAVTEEFLKLDGNKQDFPRLAPGELASETYDCDDIGAVMAADAELKTGLGFSPDEDTEVFVMDEDFECGQTITIIFTGGATDFDASISAAAIGLLLVADSPVDQ